MENLGREPKKTGIHHLVAAGSCSAGGARRLLSEAAFRHEVLFFGIVLCAFVAVAGQTESISRSGEQSRQR
jgi:diacylglycerol kinase (ATP)